MSVCKEIDSRNGYITFTISCGLLCERRPHTLRSFPRKMRKYPFAAVCSFCVYDYAKKASLHS